MALFCFAYVIRSGFYANDDGDVGDPRWFIYLTDWGFAFLTAYLLWAACVLIYHAVNGDLVEDEEEKAKKDAPLLWFHRVEWLLFNLGVTISFLVSILYWCLLFPGKDDVDSSKNETRTDVSTEIDVVMHTVNSIISLADVFLSGIPVRILHAIYPMISGLIYAVFTVIYWAADGTNSYNGEPYIYPVIDYGGKPIVASLTVTMSVFVAVPLAHLLVYGCYRLREKVGRLYCIKEVKGKKDCQSQEETCIMETM